MARWSDVGEPDDPLRADDALVGAEHEDVLLDSGTADEREPATGHDDPAPDADEKPVFAAALDDQPTTEFPAAVGSAPEPRGPWAGAAPWAVFAAVGVVVITATTTLAGWLGPTTDRNSATSIVIQPVPTTTVAAPPAPEAEPSPEPEPEPEPEPDPEPEPARPTQRPRATRAPDPPPPPPPTEAVNAPTTPDGTEQQDEAPAGDAATDDAVAAGDEEADGTDEDRERAAATNGGDDDTADSEDDDEDSEDG